MKIVVAIKQVPARDSLLKVDASGAWIDDADLSWEINEPDAYALEAGLQLRDSAGGEVVVLCAGPDRVTQTIREALAKGADRAIHIETGPKTGIETGPKTGIETGPKTGIETGPKTGIETGPKTGIEAGPKTGIETGPKTGGDAAADPLSLARSMAAALATEKPDVILTGLQSDDLGYGQTGVVLAEVMGYPHATLVMSIETISAGIRVKRELEDGWFQHVEMPLPALLTIQSGAAKLRYATLMGIKKAKSKEIRSFAADIGGASSLKLERIYLPPKSKRSQILEGTAQEAAAQLVDKLRFEARVL